MRTTVTLDDDLYRLLEQVMRKTNAPFKKVLNDAVRTGLGATAKPQEKRCVSIPIFRSGLLPGIDPAKLNHLADDLEVEEMLEKLRRSE